MSDRRHYWNRRWGKSLTLSLSLSHSVHHLPFSLSCLHLSLSQCLPASLRLKATEPLNERLHCSSAALKPRLLSLLTSDLWAKKQSKNRHRLKCPLHLFVCIRTSHSLQTTPERKERLISLKSRFLDSSFPACLLASSVGGTKTRGKDAGERAVDALKGIEMHLVSGHLWCRAVTAL